MLAAVRLDHQAELQPAEVDDAGSQRHLPAKAMAIHEAMPQLCQSLRSASVILALSLRGQGCSHAGSVA